MTNELTKAQEELTAWAATITKELTDAGFTVTDHKGWPLVAHPQSFDDMYRFLKLRLSVSCNKNIYAEGVLITPVNMKL